MSESRAERDALVEHVEQCPDCQADPPPVLEITALLRQATVDVDAAKLSRRALARLRPELAADAAAALRRRVAAVVLLSLLPLPAVLAYDACWLRLAYGVARAILPASVAAVVVLGQAAFLLFLFSATYAAIPLLVARRELPRPT